MNKEEIQKIVIFVLLHTPDQIKKSIDKNKMEIIDFFNKVIDNMVIENYNDISSSIKSEFDQAILTIEEKIKQDMIFLFSNADAVEHDGLKEEKQALIERCLEVFNIGRTLKENYYGDFIRLCKRKNPSYFNSDSSHESEVQSQVSSMTSSSASVEVCVTLNLERHGVFGGSRLALGRLPRLDIESFADIPKGMVLS